jgi:uncharacterized protein YqgQ
MELAKELAEKLGKTVSELPLQVNTLITAEEGKRQGYQVVNLVAKNPDDLAKAKVIIKELFQSGFLNKAEYNQAMSARYAQEGAKLLKHNLKHF